LCGARAGPAKHPSRCEEGDSCYPFSPGRGMRSGRETKGFVSRCGGLFLFEQSTGVILISLHTYVIDGNINTNTSSCVELDVFNKRNIKKEVS
ncbi:hypothetical protein HMPREF0083_00871, partial [Aneurinibacillus aneurinilyticus ATCC 12856]